MKLSETQQAKQKLNTRRKRLTKVFRLAKVINRGNRALNLTTVKPLNPQQIIE